MHRGPVVPAAPQGAAEAESWVCPLELLEAAVSVPVDPPAGS